jgi:hypothetical protein
MRQNSFSVLEQDLYSIAFKWVWEFTISFSLIKLFWRNGCGGMVGREALWRLVIDVKFESLRGGWCSKEVLGTFGVGVWKHIRRGWDKFYNFVRFEVGVGSHVSF